MSMPPDTPMDPSWTADASTETQGGTTDFPRVDTGTIEKADDPFAQDFTVATLLDEIQGDGYTHTTKPVGEGTPAPTRTPGTRGLTPEAR